MAHEIGRQIVSGEIEEAALLPREVDLAGKFKVSRQAVREALKVLAAKGLLETRKRRGSTVAPRSSWNLLDPDVLAWHRPTGLTPEFLRDLFELRFLIEPPAAEFAALRGNPERIARIGDAVEAIRASGRDVPAYFAADVMFHSAIFAASGNSLIDRLSTIIAPLLQAAFSIRNSIGAASERAIALHEATYRSIARGDAAGAREAMQQVLVLAEEEIRELRQQTGQQSG